MKTANKTPTIKQYKQFCHVLICKKRRLKKMKEYLEEMCIIQIIMNPNQKEIEKSFKFQPSFFFITFIHNFKNSV